MPDARSLPEDLLAAAEDEILERGLSALSLRAVARRVGVSHQAPGHHFQDRAGLITALAVRGYEGLIAAFRATEADPPADPVAAVAAQGAAYIRFAVAHPALFTTMFRSDALNPDDPTLVAVRTEAFALLGGAVQAAHAAGWGRDHDERTLAMMCWSMVHGLAGLWLDGAVPAMFATDDLDAVADQMTHALTRALAA